MLIRSGKLFLWFGHFKCLVSLSAATVLDVLAKDLSKDAEIFSF